MLQSIADPTVDRTGEVADGAKASGFDRDAAWTKCAKDVWTYEEAAVKKWSNEIDTLLVFVSFNIPASWSRH